MRFLSYLLLLLTTTQVEAVADLQTQLGQALPGVSAEIQYVHDEMMQNMRSGDLDAALAAASRVVQAVKHDAADDSALLLVQPYANLATLQMTAADYENAKTNFNLSIAIIESHKGVFAPELILPLHGLGMTFTQAGEYSDATLALRRAQHISHRIFGVYTLHQIEMVDQLANVDLLKGNVLAADQAKKFGLKINEVEYGPEDPRVVPAIEKLAAYFVSQGNNRDAVLLYRRAVEIIETNFSENDLRLSDPLLSLGKIGMQQVDFRSRGENALERRQAIISESAATDVVDRVQALVDLGDAYIISNNRKAAAVYRNAWDLIKDKTDFADLREEIFGTPFRLFPDPKIHKIHRFPSASTEELYIDVDFTVRSDGHVSDIEIVDANVPHESQRWLRSAMYHYRYRPRMVDGEPVVSEKLSLHQPFMIVKRQTSSTPIKFQQGFQ
jgi:tetratricopeptide (TPR) repeat protein|tara:strand:- start:2034 stop:3359 length:1326 start_codon:yes stop_codon:yes gene_type:complete